MLSRIFIPIGTIYAKNKHDMCPLKSLADHDKEVWEAFKEDTKESRDTGAEMYELMKHRAEVMEKALEIAGKYIQDEVECTENSTGYFYFGDDFNWKNYFIEKAEAELKGGAK
jgi:hypothetical protein